MIKIVFEVENFKGKSMSVSTSYNIKGEATISTEAINEFKDIITVMSEKKVDIIITKSVIFTESIQNIDQVNMVYVVNDDGKLVFAGSDEIQRNQIV